MDAAVRPQDGGGVIARIETVLRHAVELPTAILVLVEIGVLLAGVVSRFVFHHPFVWSDELASILFLWLAMLGAVVALQRGQHMRMTAIVAGMGAPWRERAQVLAVAVPALFLLIVLPYARDYAEDEWFIETPALGWSNIVRAGAIPVGCAIMLAGCVLRLLRFRLRELIEVAAVLAVLVVALHLAAPALKALGNWNLCFFFVLLLAAGVLLGVPIGFAFGAATVAFLICVTNAPLTIVVSRMDEGMSTLVLLAVPLFVFLGLLIEMTGMARAMVAFLAGLLGHVRGGLYYVLLGAMYLVSGISGSKAADMAAVAPVLFPEMKRRGAHEGELVAILSASGAMSETIPPSLVLITIGSVTGVSIAALFTGGLVPGLVLALALALVAWHRSRHEAVGSRASGKEIRRTLVIALPALLLPFVIRTAVVEGIATATEVSTIGIAYAVVVGIVVYRQFDLRRIYPMLLETAALSGAILLIIGTATAMGWALTQSGFSRQLAHAMASVPGGGFGFLLISIAAFVVLGSVLEGIPAIVLFGPLLFPIAHTVGINEVHYAMVVVLAMGIGLFAPPLGVGYYAACVIGRVDPDMGMKRIWPYLGALLVGLLAVAAVPWFSTGFLR
ncbi:TRAP transporter large permease [Limobrevibacterium gyesilva]|uniref:TRAP transporter large permease subunit n=1 Tax=Limobrevibacterium gyesilva TaxID=2991712 RepID=A0AA41YI93_9PROT|nr:TRAP transporter large permease subunit [Limobrevibacterium gyesilva]MCW3474029.1 TRAP transporter large permease subunit [Limobrevibacterium gyesilva]